MAGYKGWSMSNNAVAAYENGEKPLSKWTKADIIEAIENQAELKCRIEKLKKVPASSLKNVCLKCSSWHHTSNHYNKTDFYTLDVERVENLTDEDLDVTIENYKLDKKEKTEVKPTEEEWECSFLEWSGSRRHPKATEVTEIGIIKGEWFYRKNGSKKSVNSRGFRMIKKVEKTA